LTTVVETCVFILASAGEIVVSTTYLNISILPIIWGRIWLWLPVELSRFRQPIRRGKSEIVITRNPYETQPLLSEGPPLDNEQLAQRLDEIADLLDAQSANLFRRQAYRTAAETVRRLTRPVWQILSDEGGEALTRLPGIGTSIARALKRLSETGHAPLLDQLRASFGPEDKLATVPGIGPRTAATIHAVLGIETLGDLQAAAYDGRLTRVPGIGRKRLQAVRESLAGRFGRRTNVSKAPTASRVSKRASKSHTLRLVADLLSVDEEYRCKAQADELLRIAPRRFNPNGEAWLPILETERPGGRYKAMYSNTARAHEMGAVRDWVVIVRVGADDGEQWTVVTSRFGKSRGRRIIRGLERECAEHCAHPPAHALSLFDSDAEHGLDAPLADRRGQ
jgi:DNA polymerase (family 10)